MQFRKQGPNGDITMSSRGLWVQSPNPQNAHIPPQNICASCVKPSPEKHGGYIPFPEASAFSGLMESVCPDYSVCVVINMHNLQNINALSCIANRNTSQVISLLFCHKNAHVRVSASWLVFLDQSLNCI